MERTKGSYFQPGKRNLSPQNRDFETNKYLRLQMSNLNDLDNDSLATNLEISQKSESSLRPHLQNQEDLHDDTVITMDMISGFVQQNIDTDPVINPMISNMAAQGEGLQPLDPGMEQFMNEMRDFRKESQESFKCYQNLPNKVENIDKRLEAVESMAINAQSSQLKITNIPSEIGDDDFTIIGKSLQVLGMNAQGAVFEVREIVSRENLNSRTVNFQSLPVGSTASQPGLQNNKRGSIVTMTSAAAAQAVIMKMRKKKDVFISEIYSQMQSSKVYINQLYPPSVWDLFKKVRVEARNLGFSNPWVEGILIYIRKSKDTPKILIRSMNDMSELRKSLQNGMNENI